MRGRGASSSLAGLLLLTLLVGGCGWERDNPLDRKGINPPRPDIGPDTDGVPPTDQWVPVQGKWVALKAGTFTMGSPTGEPCREPDESKETQHEVTLSRSYEIRSTEVTQGDFQNLMSYNPSFYTTCGSSCPVERVSWYEAAAYCNALSLKNGLTACYECSGSTSSVNCWPSAAYSGHAIYTCPGYRLPTEAEWEYAYRADTNTAYYNGPNDSLRCATTSKDPVDANAVMIAWYVANSDKTTHAVASKLYNKWYLYDMAGNVWEWCHDIYKQDLGSSAVTDPVESGSGKRVPRGGSWDNSADDQRAARRGPQDPGTRSNQRGFRCVRTLNP